MHVACADDVYLIFDCPGQVELFTVHASMKLIAETLVNTWHVRYAGQLLALPLVLSQAARSYACTALPARPVLWCWHS